MLVNRQDSNFRFIKYVGDARFHAFQGVGNPQLKVVLINGTVRVKYSRLQDRFSIKDNSEASLAANRLRQETAFVRVGIHDFNAGSEIMEADRRLRNGSVTTYSVRGGR